MGEVVEYLPVEVCREYKADLLAFGVEDIIRSVAEVGVVEPVIARKHVNGYYEILVGRKRFRAIKRLGRRRVPAIVRELTDEEACIILIDTNLTQNVETRCKKSEIADILYEYHKLLKHQGMRTDLIQEVENIMQGCGAYCKYDGVLESGKPFNMSARNVSRYLRIHELDNSLRVLLDSERIGVRVAVELSYVEKGLQEYIAKLIEVERIVLSYDMSIVLHRHQVECSISRELIRGLLVKEKENIYTLRDVYKKYGLSYFSREEICSIVDNALAYYLKDNSSQVKKSWG